MGEEEKKLLKALFKIFLIVLFLSLPAIHSNFILPLRADLETKKYVDKNCRKTRAIVENMNFEVKRSNTNEEMYVQLYTLGKYCSELARENEWRVHYPCSYKEYPIGEQARKNIPLIKDFEKAKVHEIIENSVDSEKFSKEDKELFLEKYDEYLTQCRYGYFYMIYRKAENGDTGLCMQLSKIGGRGNIAENMVKYMRPDAINNSIQAERAETTKNINEYWNEKARKERIEKEKKEKEWEKRKNASSYTFYGYSRIDDEDFEGYDDGDDWAADMVESGAWDDYDDAFDYWEDNH